MGILNFFESIPLKKLTGLATVFALSLSIPVSAWVAQQQTRITSQAFFEKPTLPTPEKQYGSPSSGNPKISLVWPFLGKSGDSVLIYGENFGNNPQDKSLFLGGQTVTENSIIRWTPTLIEFKIPSLTPNGISEAISLSITGKTTSWLYPLTIYDLGTKIQAVKEGQILKIINPPTGGKVEIFFNDGEKLESSQFEGVLIPEGKTIISLVVKDSADGALPFFVEPNEFGF